MTSTETSFHAVQKWKPAGDRMSGREALEFIGVCISHEPPSLRRRKAQEVLSCGTNWSLVWREALRHGVLPLFLHHLEELAGPHIPDPVREQMKKHRRANRIRASFLTQELRSVLHRFDGADLPVLTMKGPVLAKTAYGDVALRNYVDLDVFIPANRFVEARALLKDMGYDCKTDKKGLGRLQRRTLRYFSGQWHFVKGGRTFNIDVHTRLFPPKFSFSADFNTFWERSQPVRLSDDGLARRFSTEDMVLILAYHGMKNQWRALKHVSDLSGLLEGTGGLDWNQLMKRCRILSSERVLALALRLAHDVMRVELPAPVLDWIRDQDVRDPARLMQEYLYSRSSGGESEFEARIRSPWRRADLSLQLAVQDTLADKARYIAFTALQFAASEFIRL